MFRAAHRSSSGALTVFAAYGLHTHVVTGRCQVWVGTGWLFYECNIASSNIALRSFHIYNIYWPAKSIISLYLNLDLLYLLTVGVEVIVVLNLYSSGRVIGPSQRPLTDNTQHSQETDIDATGGIQTRNPNTRTAADTCRTPRGYWDLLDIFFLFYIVL
jgi:hypothetical protein